MSSAPAMRAGCWNPTARAAAAWVCVGGLQGLAASSPLPVMGGVPLLSEAEYCADGHVQILGGSVC